MISTRLLSKKVKKMVHFHKFYRKLRDVLKIMNFINYYEFLAKNKRKILVVHSHFMPRFLLGYGGYKRHNMGTI